MICKERYILIKKNKWADKNKEPDLWAAQQILKVVRNALGHMKVQGNNLIASATWDFSKEKEKLGVLEVKKIGVVLDTINLQDQMFAWSHMGGLANFIKVLNFLKEHLS